MARVFEADCLKGLIIGILITTVGISLLTLGLVGASIEVYRRLLSARFNNK